MGRSGIRQRWRDAAPPCDPASPAVHTCRPATTSACQAAIPGVAGVVQRDRGVPRCPAFQRGAKPQLRLRRSGSCRRRRSCTPHSSCRPPRAHPHANAWATVSSPRLAAVRPALPRAESPGAGDWHDCRPARARQPERRQLPAAVRAVRLWLSLYGPDGPRLTDGSGEALVGSPPPPPRRARRALTAPWRRARVHPLPLPRACCPGRAGATLLLSAQHLSIHFRSTV